MNDEILRQLQHEQMIRDLSKTRQKLGRGVQKFRQAALRQPDFSQEQQALRELFGHGEKIWGLPDSTTGVQINRDLCSGDTETGNLFGFGNQNFPNEHRTGNLFGF